MKSAMFLLPLILAGGCATVQRDTYFFSGSQPPWFMSIVANEIHLSIGRYERHLTTPLEEHRFAINVTRESVGSRIWEAEDAAGRIVVEATQGGCEASAGIPVPERVRVRLGDREFAGCGGRMRLVSGI